MTVITILQIPLYRLYGIKDVKTDNLFRYWERFISSYTDEERKRMIEAINWATKNPDYDFTSLLPDLRHSNEDILFYLTQLDDFFQKNQ